MINLSCCKNLRSNADIVSSFHIRSLAAPHKETFYACLRANRRPSPPRRGAAVLRQTGMPIRPYRHFALSFGGLVLPSCHEACSPPVPCYGLLHQLQRQVGQCGRRDAVFAPPRKEVTTRCRVGDKVYRPVTIRYCNASERIYDDIYYAFGEAYCTGEPEPQGHEVTLWAEEGCCGKLYSAADIDLTHAVKEEGKAVPQSRLDAHGTLRRLPPLQVLPGQRLPSEGR